MDEQPLGQHAVAVDPDPVELGRTRGTDRLVEQPACRAVDLVEALDHDAPLRAADRQLTQLHPQSRVVDGDMQRGGAALVVAVGRQQQVGDLEVLRVVARRDDHVAGPVGSGPAQRHRLAGVAEHHAHVDRPEPWQVGVGRVRLDGHHAVPALAQGLGHQRGRRSHPHDHHVLAVEER